VAVFANVEPPFGSAHGVIISSLRRWIPEVGDVIGSAGRLGEGHWDGIELRLDHDYWSLVGEELTRMDDKVLNNSKRVGSIYWVQQDLELHRSTCVIQILSNNMPSSRMPNQNEPIDDIGDYPWGRLSDVTLDINIHPANHFLQDVGHYIGQRGL
jgi:hypothetical protein